MATTIKFLGQRVAQQIDVDLMKADGCGFALEQLMELAGLGCAEVSVRVYL